MKVIVKAGKAWINGYYYENDNDLTLLIENADGVLNRIDRVVVRLDLAQREISVQIKKGTYSSNAVAEEIERNSDIYELAIADIYISNGVISLNNSNITDLRLNKELCGVVCGTIDEVDTTDIFNTYQYYLDEKINGDEFNEWFIGLKNRLDPNEDAALQLQIQINELEKKLGDSLKTDGTVQENLNADMIDGKQADGELITNEKENLVTAINEVFTYASNGKEKIAKALTGLLNITISDSSTFHMLADKINGIAKLNAKTYTPSTSNQIINKNQYINEVQTIKGDANLISSNIVEGKRIFGVNGSANIGTLGGRKYVAGTVSTNIAGWSGSSSSHTFYTHSIAFDFKPILFLYATSGGTLYNITPISNNSIISQTSSTKKYIRILNNCIEWVNDNSSSWSVNGEWIAVG